jgi:DNA mismatch endonuclease (patch repair protein)
MSRPCVPTQSAKRGAYLGYTPPDEGRSRLMAAVRSRGNRTTEMRFVRLCRKAAIAGWRRHVPLPGRPDFVFRKPRVAVFVDGCFWHGCPRCYRAPRTNAAFWERKVRGNLLRDRLIAKQLRASGWTVVRIWEHSLRDPTKVINRVRRALRNGDIAATA